MVSAYNRLKHYEIFKELLKATYGIEPADVGIDHALDLRVDMSPTEMVVFIGQKYGLKALPGRDPFQSGNEPMDDKEYASYVRKHEQLQRRPENWRVIRAFRNNAPDYWLVTDKAFKGTVLARCDTEEKANEIVRAVNRDNMFEELLEACKEAAGLFASKEALSADAIEVWNHLERVLTKAEGE